MLHTNESIEQMILNELADVDELFNDSLSLLKKVASTKTQGSLAFVHNQTANVVGIKSLKASLLRDLVGLHKKEFSDELKLNAGKDNGENTSDPEFIEKVANRVAHKMLDSEGNVTRHAVPSQDRGNVLIELDQDETDMENALSERVSKLPKNLSSVSLHKVTEEEISEYELVVVSKDDGDSVDIQLLRVRTSELLPIDSGMVELNESDFELGESPTEVYYKGKILPVLHTE